MRNELIEMARMHFEAHVHKHRMNVEILLQNPVGVAANADIMEAIEKELAFIADYHDKMEMLDEYFSE